MWQVTCGRWQLTGDRWHIFIICAHIRKHWKVFFPPMGRIFSLRAFIFFNTLLFQHDFINYQLSIIRNCDWVPATFSQYFCQVLLLPVLGLVETFKTLWHWQWLSKRSKYQSDIGLYNQTGYKREVLPLAAPHQIIRPVLADMAASLLLLSIFCLTMYSKVPNIKKKRP